MNDTPIFNFPLTYSAVISKVAEFLGAEDYLIISNESEIAKAIDCANSLYNKTKFSSPEHKSSFLMEESAVLWLTIKPYIAKRSGKDSKAKFPVFHFPLKYSEVISDFAKFEDIKDPVVKHGKIPKLEEEIRDTNLFYSLRTNYTADPNILANTVEEACAALYEGIKPYIVENDEASKAKFPEFHFPLDFDEVISDFAKFEGIKDPIVKYDERSKIEVEIHGANQSYNLALKRIYDFHRRTSVIEDTCAKLYENIKPYITECNKANEDPYYNPNINNILRDINTLIERSAVSIEQACRIIALAQKDQEIEAMRRQTFALERVSHKQF